MIFLLYYWPFLYKGLCPATDNDPRKRVPERRSLWRKNIFKGGSAVSFSVPAVKGKNVCLNSPAVKKKTEEKF